MKNQISLEIPAKWPDYELLDSGGARRLEKFGPFILSRPDPQAIWSPKLSQQEWMQADATFIRDKSGKEYWVKKKKVPEQWKMKYENVQFWARLTPFKHTGVFPEQTSQWSWMSHLLKKEYSRPMKILNLFAYTGIASLVCAAANAHVTHVDASRPAITWARENQALSGLVDKPIRWILDDALTFVQREIKRKNYYDGIIMDPPIYGHGPKGEKWNFSTHFPQLVRLCSQVLTAKPLFFIVNAYAISSSSLMLYNTLESELGNFGGNIHVGELTLQENKGSRLLSTGIFARWSR